MHAIQFATLAVMFNQTLAIQLHFIDNLISKFQICNIKHQRYIEVYQLYIIQL